MLEMTQEDFNAMSDEQRMSVLSGDGAAPEDVQIAELAPTLESPVGAAPPEQVGQPPEKDYAAIAENYKGAMAEARGKYQALVTALSDPNQLAQIAAQMGYQLTDPNGGYDDEGDEPDLEFENPDAIRSMIAKEVGPLAQQLQQAQSYINHLESQAQSQYEAQWVVEQYGPDAIQNVRAFDAQYPDLRDTPIGLKHVAMVGLQYSNPAQMQSLINQKAEQLATARIEQLLKGGKARDAVTIDGIMPVGGSSPDADVGSLSQEDWDKLPEAKRNVYLYGK